MSPLPARTGRTLRTSLYQAVRCLIADEFSPCVAFACAVAVIDADDGDPQAVTVRGPGGAGARLAAGVRAGEGRAKGEKGSASLALEAPRVPIRKVS